MTDLDEAPADGADGSGQPDDAAPPPPSRTRRAIVVVAVVALVGLLAWASFAVLSRGDDTAESKLLGQPVPVLSLADAESGQVFQLSAPGKVLVINFWAPWCIPCRPEHEMLNQLALQLSPDDVTIIGIAYQSRPDDVRSFLDDVGRNIRSFADDDGRASIEFGVTGVPETFVVDAAGIVRRHVVGPLADGQLEQIVTELQATAS